MKKILLLLILLCTNFIHAQLVVNNTTITPAQLVQTVLLGTGVTASNITYNGSAANANTFRDQAGRFSNGVSTNIGIDSGLILSTGKAQLAIGPNNSGSSTNATTTATYVDADLASLSTSGLTKTSVLEFDFVPTGEELKFNFVFASEEYPEFAPSSYNDVFGFFLSGPGITGPYSNGAVNIARIPTTTTGNTVVSINNVNATTNNIYYVSNGTGTTPLINQTIQYDGFTTVLTALSNIICGQTYHIKLAIANAGDNSYDSAVFIQGGSFAVEPINFPQDYLVSNGFAPCAGTVTEICTGLATTVNHVWTLNGDIIPGENGPCIDATLPGLYCVTAYPYGLSCPVEDCITLEILPPLPLNEPNDLTECSNLFDLTENTPVILGSFNAEISYFTTQQDADDLTNPIPNPAAFIGFNGQIIYVRVDDTSGSNCFDTTLSFVLYIDSTIPTPQPVPNLTVCANVGTPNVGTFDFSNQTVIALGSYNPANYTVSYHLTAADANADLLPITNFTSYQNITNPQTIYLRLEKNCNFLQYGVTSFQLIVNPLPTATITVQPTVCQNAASPNVVFTGSGGTAPYTFVYNTGGADITSPPSTGDTFTLAVPTGTPGVFTYNLVSVTDATSTLCNQVQTSSATITVNALPEATISGTSDHCINTGSPEITFTGTVGTAPFVFTYNVNNGPTQTTPASTGSTYVLPVSNTTAGILNYNLLSVTDANGCSQAQTGTATVTINPLPTASISGTASVCLNDPNPNITLTGIVGTAPFTFTYSINTVVQPTVTTTTGNSFVISVPSSPVGTYTYELLNVQDSSSTACSQPQTGTATITVIAAPIIVNPTPYVICDDNNNGQGCFDLHTKDLEITGGNSTLQVSYHETLIDAQNGAAAITQNPYCTPNFTGFYTVYVSVFDPAAPACSSITTLDLITNPRPLPNPVITTYALCDYNNPGDNQELFDLTTKDLEIANTQSGVTITYYETQGAALLQTPSIATPTAYPNTTPTQTIWFTITDNTTGCFSVGSFTIRVNSLPTVFPTPANFQCSNGASNQAFFNLSLNNSIVTGGVPGIIVTYYNNLLDAQTPQNAISSTSYLGTDFEIVYIRLQNSATGCYSTSSVELRVTQGPVANTPTPLQYCDPNNDGLGIFNLEDATAEIAGSNPPPAGVSVSYYETMTDAMIGASPSLTGPYATIDPDGTTTIYVRVFYTLTGCANYVELQLIVNPTPEATQPAPYHECDDNYDGYTFFDLTTQTPIILGSIDPTTHTVEYYTTQANAIAGDSTLAITSLAAYTNGTINTETLWVRVENNATGCFDVVSLVLVVDPLPNATQPNYAPYSLCETPAPTGSTVGYEPFDLQSQIAAISLGQPGLNVTFHYSEIDAAGDTGALPLQYVNVDQYVQTLWIRIENAATGCYVLSTMDIRVDPLPTPIPPTAPYIVCDTDQDGISTFDLSTLTPDILQGANYIITYYETQTNAEIGDPVNQLPTIYNNISNAFVVFLWVRAEDPVTGCFTVMQIELNVNPSPIMPPLSPLVLCDEDNNNQNQTVNNFNLEQQTPIILAAQQGAASNYTVTYYETLADADASPMGMNPIIPTTAYQNEANPQTIWVRVQHNTTGCFEVSSFELQVNTPLALTTPTALNVCNNDSNSTDLYTEFNLTVKDGEITQNLPGYTVTYYPSWPITPTSIAIPNPTAYTNILGPSQTLGVMVTSAEGCRSYTTLTIRVLPIPVANTPPALAAQCDNNNPGDMVEVFDLTTYETLIMNNNPDVTLHYYPSYADAINTPPTNEIVLGSPYGPPNAALVGQNVWIRVESDLFIGSDGVRCYDLVEQALQVNPLPNVGLLDNGNIYQICEEDPTINNGIEVFDLTTQIPELLAANAPPASDYSVAFYTANPPTAANQIGNPSAYSNTTSPNSQTIYVVVTNTITGCQSTVGSFDIVVNPKPDLTTPPNFTTCDSDGTNNGLFDYPLDVLEPAILGTQLPADYTVTFYDTEYNPDATPPLTPAPIADEINYQTYTHTIWVAVTNNVTGCYKISSFNSIVEQLPQPVITTVNNVDSICVDFVSGTVVRDLELSITNTTVYLNPNIPTYSYQWLEDGVVIPGATNATYVVNQSDPNGATRDYTVIMTSTTGNNTPACDNISPAFPVIQSGQATPVTEPGYTITNAFSDNQIITVDVQGYGTYLYSLDNGPEQASPIFTNVGLGVHFITVRDTKGSCDPLIIYSVQTIDYPLYFTPNGDNINDYWNIRGLNQANSKIYIFDRYGKLIKQISATGQGWDGTYNGQPLPSTDYWFTVDYLEQTSKQFKAHFSLKR